MQNKPVNCQGFLIIVVIAVIFSSCTLHTSDTIITENTDLISAIKNSAGYLQRNVNKDGTFNYLINMNQGVKVKQSYNILRHAGSIYSLTQYYQSFGDEDIVKYIELAGMYLKSMTGPLPEKKDILVVWSLPEVNKVRKFKQAKLGGTGLGLIALVGIEKIIPGFTPLDDLRNMGDFIVFMQKKDGSFYSMYIPESGGIQDDWHSRYYPGEAALGLLMLNDIDPSEKWAEPAARALEYLARKYKQKGTVVDHWTLLATEKLFESGATLTVNYDRRLLLDNAINISRLIIKEQIHGAMQHTLNGGFTFDGRTTPTSTRLEGLLATLNIMKDDYELRREIEFSVKQGIGFLLNAQVRAGPYKGAFPSSIINIPMSTPSIAKRNKRATEVRIDYVQHALSAMIQYYNYFITDS